eukprot:m.11632 g.11632  ORF g.11632 m.11632 type:complete len:420 (+) comp23526_c0_seq1:88-1347(+)
MERLKAFYGWCEAVNLRVGSKVVVSEEGSCAQYGMVAREGIRKGARLLSIPRAAILSISSPQVEKVVDLLLKDGLVPSKDPQEPVSADEIGINKWIPLLVVLMREYADPGSFWRPYFDLCPDFELMDPLILWNPDEADSLLKGTGLLNRLKDQTKQIENDYEKIVQPFISRYKELFHSFSLELFKKMVAFVSGYSFTDSSYKNDYTGIMMVPSADILNHHSKNNARLLFKSTTLEMVACRAIKAGEEVFNTYGALGNDELMISYGFAEKHPNPNDSAVILVALVAEEAKERGLDSRLVDVCGMMDVDEGDGFVVDLQGECEGTLVGLVHLLALTVDKYEEVVASDEEVDLPGDVHDLFDLSKELLKALVLRRLAEFYESDISVDLERLKHADSLKPREKYALYVRLGQKQSLHSLLLSL